MQRENQGMDLFSANYRRYKERTLREESRRLVNGQRQLKPSENVVLAAAYRMHSASAGVLITRQSLGQSSR